MGRAVVVKAGHVPSAGELTAHVRTAVDGTVRWIDRVLATPGGDPEAWDQRAFYARMMLMRGLERGELLGWVLQRDGLAERDTERGVAIRQASAYWAEARPDLHEAIAGMRRASDLPPHSTTARDTLTLARDQLDAARGWLRDLADGLAVDSRDRKVERDLERPAPDTSLGLDLL